MAGLGHMNCFNNCFRNRRVLVTGHTGFKGAWLSEWLLSLGADVTGISLEPSTKPNLFSLLDLSTRLQHVEQDIRNGPALTKIFHDIQPEIVFHLAAQPLVRPSYSNPKETWDTNVGGTVNLLEALRSTPSVRSCVIVTSDKCYENREWVWGYREHEAMGGHDPYSSSKGAAELAVASWRNSFFEDEQSCNIATARAGNVIGGGDWSPDRLVVDFIQCITQQKTLYLRNPQATRPWQHVLEPLSGYLLLAEKLLSPRAASFVEGWNIGPSTANAISVGNLASGLVAAWGSGEIDKSGQSNQPHEAHFLQLDTSKAATHLNWHGIWDIERTIAETVTWYKSYYDNAENMRNLTIQQIATYCEDAQVAGLPWAAKA